MIYHPTAHTVVVNLDKTTLLPGEVANGIVVVYNIVQEDIRGPPVGKIGAGQPVVTDYACAVGYPSWENPVTGDTVSGINTKTVGIDYETRQELVKTASPEEGAPHSQTTFHITVSNTGNVLLNRTELRDYLPEGLSFVSATPPETSVSISGGITTIYWTNLCQSFNAVLNPGDHFDVDVVASFNGDKYGKLTNLVTNIGYNLRNESITNTTEKDVIARKPNIVVVKTPNISSGSVGAVVNFTLNVTNTGNISLTNVFVRDVLPAGMSYISSSKGGINNGLTVTWQDIGPLGAGSSKSLWIKALIDGSKFGLLTNVVDVIGQPEYGENVTSRATADVEAQAAGIIVDKVANPSEGTKGAIITFPMKITNQETMKMVRVLGV
ncbi:MAG: DUF11 domain-containing protein, partial [Methanothrix sp.]|nr:DUF11 domain-containing protein [Methanothrix sp.]